MVDKNRWMGTEMCGYRDIEMLVAFESGTERSLGRSREKNVMDGFRGYGLRGDVADWQMENT